MNHESNISIITKIELLGWNFPNPESFHVRNDFVDKSNTLALSDDIANKTIEIRRLHKIKLPDAIISATAIVFDFTLISRNDKDFESIAGLKYVNPFNQIS